MKIAAVSDTHGKLLPEHLPEADVLVIAGDYCPNFPNNGARDRFYDARKQLEWLRKKFKRVLAKTAYKKVIVIAGNHDFVHEDKDTASQAREALEPAVYLQDELYEFEGLKFFGSPWTPWFYEWAFQFGEHDPLVGYPDARRRWAVLPEGVDVLITHGPPHNLLDLAPGNRHVGCPVLREHVFGKVKPQLHLFGHIHGAYGAEMHRGIAFANVALCDEDYIANQRIQVIEVTPREKA